MKKIIEEMKLDVAIDAADVDTSDQTSAVFLDMANYDRVAVVAKSVALTAGKKLTVQLKQATDAAGSAAKALGAAVVGTAVSGALAPQVLAEVGADAMDAANGFTFVGVTIGTDEGSSKAGCAVLVRGGARQMPVS